MRRRSGAGRQPSISASPSRIGPQALVGHHATQMEVLARPDDTLAALRDRREVPVTDLVVDDMLRQRDVGVLEIQDRILVLWLRKGTHHAGSLITIGDGVGHIRSGRTMSDSPLPPWSDDQPPSRRRSRPGRAGRADHSEHAQRSCTATSASTSSMWAPQPFHPGFPQSPHVTRRHMRPIVRTNSCAVTLCRHSGRRFAQGWAASSCAATRINRSSRPYAATSWTPMGKPSPFQCSGRLIAG